MYYSIVPPGFMLSWNLPLRCGKPGDTESPFPCTQVILTCVLWGSARYPSFIVPYRSAGHYPHLAVNPLPSSPLKSPPSRLQTIPLMREAVTSPTEERIYFGASTLPSRAKSPPPPCRRHFPHLPYLPLFQWLYPRPTKATSSSSLTTSSCTHFHIPSVCPLTAVRFGTLVEVQQCLASPSTFLGIHGTSLIFNSVYAASPDDPSRSSSNH